MVAPAVIIIAAGVAAVALAGDDEPKVAHEGLPGGLVGPPVPPLVLPPVVPPDPPSHVSGRQVEVTAKTGNYNGRTWVTAGNLPGGHLGPGSYLATIYVVMKPTSSSAPDTPTQSVGMYNRRIDIAANGVWASDIQRVPQYAPTADDYRLEVLPAADGGAEARVNLLRRFFVADVVTTWTFKRR